MSRLFLLSLTIVLCSTSAQAQESDIQVLSRRVEQLERRVAELERRLQSVDAGTPARPAAPQATMGDATQIGNWRRLRQGMSMDDVPKLLGEPDRVDVIVFTLWTYGSASVTFDPNSQKVSGWSEPRDRR